MIPPNLNFDLAQGISFKNYFCQNGWNQMTPKKMMFIKLELLNWGFFFTLEDSPTNP